MPPRRRVSGIRKYQGSCHCGSIRFEFVGDAIDAGMRCDCSICRRKGSVLTDYTVPPGSIRIVDQAHRLTAYQFGSGVAKHYFCSVCGVFTFVQTRLNPGEYRINVGCVEDVDPFTLPVTVYDGRSLP